MLERASLATGPKVGRQRSLSLAPLPIKRIHDHWISDYMTAAVELLEQLDAAGEINLAGGSDNPFLLGTQVGGEFADVEQGFETPGVVCGTVFGAHVEQMLGWRHMNRRQPGTPRRGPWFRLVVLVQPAANGAKVTGCR